MKYVKNFESFDHNVNEEFLGGLLSAAKGALKNFLTGVTAPFKSLKDDFKKGMKLEDIKKKITTTVDAILKSATDNINKAEDENAINQIKDAFRKELDEKVLEFDKEIKAVKESKEFVINEGLVKDTMVGARVMLGMLKDTAAKLKIDFDKKFAAAKDIAAKKAVAVDEMKAVANDFKKQIADSNILKTATDKYMADNKIEGGGSSAGIILDWGDVEVEVKAVDGDVAKKHPGYYQIVKSGSKKLVVKEGEVVLAKISGKIKKGDKVKLSEILRGDQPDPLKEYETGPLERIVVDGKEVGEYEFKSEVAPGQDDLAKKLGDMKTKKPDDIKKVSNFVDFIGKEENKDKIGEIEKIMTASGGE
jgi:hypothetical protein